MLLYGLPRIFIKDNEVWPTKVIQFGDDPSCPTPLFTVSSEVPIGQYQCFPPLPLLFNPGAKPFPFCPVQFGERTLKNIDMSGPPELPVRTMIVLDHVILKPCHREKGNQMIRYISVNVDTGKENVVANYANEHLGVPDPTRQETFAEFFALARAVRALRIQRAHMAIDFLAGILRSMEGPPCQVQEHDNQIDSGNPCYTVSNATLASAERSRRWTISQDTVVRWRHWHESVFT
ncbi:hypothetical protein AOQ84DRAFT_387870 [Glonium stellatum]|uniref:Uncharacterized protein n=1 Tax=Glonium stellatum TaxID=574774 RepID=A0A8E2F3P6_9PEZI|nr:hypothetical protein AOQ84DRAFT_387870 [Glonium stellatum]